MWQQDDDDPNDPKHPDFDLSEAGINYYVPDAKPWFLRRWFVFLICGLVLLALMLPLVSLI